MLHLEMNNDPNYFGYITFEMPDKLFVYIAEGSRGLIKEQVKMIIEFFSDYRTNPALWKTGRFNSPDIQLRRTRKDGNYRGRIERNFRSWEP